MSTKTTDELVEQACDLIQQLQKRMQQAEHDRLTLALRLYGDDFESFGPETREVMERMIPEIQALLKRVTG